MKEKQTPRQIAEEIKSTPQGEKSALIQALASYSPEMNDLVKAAIALNLKEAQEKEAE